MEGVAGIVKWISSAEPTDGLRGRTRPLHRGDQRGRARREGGRRDGDRRHGLPRRRRRLQLQLPRSRAPRSCVRVRRTAGVDRVHGLPRVRLRRRSLRRHARNGGNGRRRALPYGLGAGVAKPAVQRDARRRDRDQRRALRPLGRAGRARDGRPRGVPGGEGAARRRPHHGRGEGGARPFQRADENSAGGARADRGRRERRCPTSRPSQPYDPGSPSEIAIEFTRPTACRSSRTARASRSPARARSSSAATTGGLPGRASSSRGRSPAGSPATRRRGRTSACRRRWVARVPRSRRHLDRAERV